MSIYGLITLCNGHSTPHNEVETQSFRPHPRDELRFLLVPTKVISILHLDFLEKASII